jgi:hypothetical protein
MGALISLKDCVSQASMEIGISPRPITTAIASLDQDIVQMTALLYAVADEVMSEEPYRVTLGDGYWIFSIDGTPMLEFENDDDLIAFDRRLAIDGLKYRFLKAKGLEFGEEMRDFLSRLNKLGVRANGRVLDLDIAAGAGNDWDGSPWGYVGGYRWGGRQQ